MAMSFDDLDEPFLQSCIAVHDGRRLPTLEQILPLVPELHRAAASGESDQLQKLLLDADADKINQGSLLDWTQSDAHFRVHSRAATPLSLACEFGHARGVAMLMQRGAKIRVTVVRAHDGHPAVVVDAGQQAMAYGHLSCARELLEARVGTRLCAEATKLRSTVRKGLCTIPATPRMLQFFVEFGVSINAHAGSGSSLIAIACKGGDERFLRYLLQHNASLSGLVDGQDRNGPPIIDHPALYHACQAGHVGCVRLLLAHGAKADTEQLYPRPDGTIGVYRSSFDSSALCTAIDHQHMCTASARTRGSRRVGYVAG